MDELLPQCSSDVNETWYKWWPSGVNVQVNVVCWPRHFCCNPQSGTAGLSITLSDISCFFMLTPSCIRQGKRHRAFSSSTSWTPSPSLVVGTSVTPAALRIVSSTRSWQRWTVWAPRRTSSSSAPPTGENLKTLWPIISAVSSIDTCMWRMYCKIGNFRAINFLR